MVEQMLSFPTAQTPSCLAQVHKQQTEAAWAGKASFSWAWLLDERCPLANEPRSR